MNSILSGLLVIPGVSTLPCLPLMLSLKTIILKYFLVCVFLVSPCCVHRNRRPDQTVSVVPSPRFDLFVFSSVLFVPVFCPSRQASPLAVSPHARGSREFTPPFAALPSRGSRDFMPAVRGSSRRRSRLSHPAVRGSWRRRSRLCHPAVRGSSRRRLRINQPSVPGGWRLHPRLTLARRPASDSMPAGLPLTQCPPACLWLYARRPASDSSSPGVPLTQARRIAADSSSPDCRWLKLAGLPLTHATGRRQGRPTHHLFVSRRRPRPTSVSRASSTRGKPTRRPRFTRPAAGWGSLQPAGPCRWVVKPAGCCRYCQAGRLWSRQPAAAEFDKPAGRGRIWPVSDHGLFNCLCVFSPGRAPGTPKLPHGNFLGGVQRSRLLWPGRGTRPRPPWTTGLGLLSSLLHLGLRLFVPLWRPRPVYVSVSVLRGLQSAHPPPRWNCYGSGRAFREGGSYVRGVLCVSCVLASRFM